MPAWRTKATIFLAVATAALFVLLQPDLDIPNPSEGVLSLPADTPDIFVTGVNLTRFDRAGQLQLSLIGESLALYNDRDETFVNQPDVTLYNDQQANWRITSAVATLFGAEQALFEGDVVATELERSTTAQLFSEAMTINPTEQTLSSDVFVRLSQGPNTATAIGMTAKVDTMGSTIHLLSEVTFSYDPLINR